MRRIPSVTSQMSPAFTSLRMTLFPLTQSVRSALVPRFGMSEIWGRAGTYARDLRPDHAVQAAVRRHRRLDRALGHRAGQGDKSLARDADDARGRRDHCSQVAALQGERRYGLSQLGARSHRHLDRLVGPFEPHQLLRTIEHDRLVAHRAELHVRHAGVELHGYGRNGLDAVDVPHDLRVDEGEADEVAARGDRHEGVLTQVEQGFLLVEVALQHRRRVAEPHRSVESADHGDLPGVEPEIAAGREADGRAELACGRVEGLDLVRRLALDDDRTALLQHAEGLVRDADSAGQVLDLGVHRAEQAGGLVDPEDGAVLETDVGNEKAGSQEGGGDEADGDHQDEESRPVPPQNLRHACTRPTHRHSCSPSRNACPATRPPPVSQAKSSGASRPHLGNGYAGRPTVMTPPSPRSRIVPGSTVTGVPGIMRTGAWPGRTNIVPLVECRSVATMSQSFTATLRWVRLMSLLGLGMGRRIGLPSPAWAAGARPISTVSVSSMRAPPAVISWAITGLCTRRGLALSTGWPHLRHRGEPGGFGCPNEHTTASTRLSLPCRGAAGLCVMAIPVEKTVPSESALSAETGRPGSEGAPGP